MALTKNVMLKTIEIDPNNGVVFLVFKKQILDDGNMIMEENHRSEIPLGVEVVDQIALVNATLAGLGYPNVMSANVTKLTTLITALRGG